MTATKFWQGSTIALLVVLAGLLTAICLHVTGNLMMFEDGSWGIGTFPYIVDGCLPFTCN